MKTIILLAALAGCTSFDSIERGVCGNGIIELGEDCDSDDASCASCSVVCAAASDCPSEAYACGVDGLCHAPGGALGQPATSPGTFQSHELQITDVDHDGIGDVLGLSQTSIVVRHGDPAAALAAEESVLTPAQTGPAAFGDLDGDGSLDLTLTTLDGLVSYTSPYGALAPLAVQSVVIDPASNQPLDIRMMFHVADFVFSGFIVDPTTQAMVVFAIDFSNPNLTASSMAFAPVCGVVRATDFDPKNVVVYNVNREDAAQLDTVVALISGSSTTRKLCVLAIHRDAPPLFGAYPNVTIANVTGAMPTPAKLPVLADLDADADRCPGVVDRDGGPKQLRWRDGAMTATGCTFAATATALPAISDAAPGVEVIGRIPVDPPAPLVAADGLVTSDSVYVFAPSLNLYGPVYRTTRRLAFVVSGRIDGDDQVDAVVVAENSDDLDVLLRVPNEAGFQLLRLDTASAVSSVTLGDYDGNGLADIGFTESQEDHERLMIAYGTPDRPLAPVSVGAFPEIISVTRIQRPDSIDYLGIAEDLIVVGPPAAGSSLYRMTILHGSPQRTMLSYFDPRQDAYKDETLFRGAIIGDFAPSGATEYQDVLAIAPAARTSTAPVRAWRVPGTVVGLDGTATPGVEVQGVVDCSTAPSVMLCLDDARYLAFPVAPTRDVVIGVDRRRHAIMIDPWSTANPIAAVSLAPLTEKYPANTVPHSLHAADLDGDGNAELIAAFAPSVATATGAIVVCTMQGGVAQSCEDVVPAIIAAASASGETIEHCFDAAPAKIPTMDVVAVCRGTSTGLYRVHAGTEVTRLATTSAPFGTLRAGDVTGDGVDDIVVVSGDAVKSLVVYPQCTSRDAGCVAGGGS